MKRLSITISLVTAGGIAANERGEDYDFRDELEWVLSLFAAETNTPEEDIVVHERDRYGGWMTILLPEGQTDLSEPQRLFPCGVGEITGYDVQMIEVPEQKEGEEQNGEVQTVADACEAAARETGAELLDPARVQKTLEHFTLLARWVKTLSEEDKASFLAGENQQALSADYRRWKATQEEFGGNNELLNRL